MTEIIITVPKVVSEKVRHLTFGDLSQGDIFRLPEENKGNLFVKANPNDLEQEMRSPERNAICLNDGDSTYFYKEDEVEFIKTISYNENDIVDVIIKD